MERLGTRREEKLPELQEAPCVWGHIPLSHPRVTRWPLQTEVEMCLPRTQSKRWSSFILLQIALALLCGPQSQPTTKNAPLCFKPTLHLLVGWQQQPLLGGSPSFHPSIHSPTESRISFLNPNLILKLFCLKMFSSFPQVSAFSSIFYQRGASLIAQLVKNPPAMQKTPAPGSGRSTGEGIGDPSSVLGLLLRLSW